MRTTPEEAQELFGDLLISVTQFFRDEARLRGAGGEGDRAASRGGRRRTGVRAWSVGCATGEEAYSLAILFLEEAERRKVKSPIQIFASDLDEGALGTAREGRYPRSIEADVSEERLERFFIDEGTHYRVRKELRDVVLFASHSVLKDPPFMRLDLIACRNLLIYLERSLQEQLLEPVPLRPEARRRPVPRIGGNRRMRSEFFAPIDREARIYRALPQTRRHMPALPHGGPEHVASAARAVRRSPHRDRHRARHWSSMPRRSSRPRRPACWSMRASRSCTCRRSAGRFIQHSAGTFSGKLAEVVRPELRLDLKVALDRALEARLPTMTHPTPVRSTARSARHRDAGRAGAGARGRRARRRWCCFSTAARRCRDREWSTNRRRPGTTRSAGSTRN